VTLLKALWHGVLEVDRLIRLHFLVFSCVWPLMGATSVQPDLGWIQVGALLAATLCFHSFAMVLNDVIDLPIDRTDPRRQRDPLVRGAIRPWQALTFALIQPLLTVPLTMVLGGGWPAHLALAVGFAAMAAYDVWGKRCAIPPLTDALQGIGWASLAVYAAYAIGGVPTPLTWLIAAYVACFTLLFNGVHGPLRDLGNDRTGGAMTTAILLGAHPVPGTGIPAVPRALAIYAWTILAALLLIQGAVLVRNDFGYSSATWIATTTIAVALNGYVVRLQSKVLRPDDPVWASAFRLQLYVITINLPLTFMASASAEFLLALLLVTALSLSLFDATPGIARWLWRSIAPSRSSGSETEAASRLSFIPHDADPN
jgi:4-hydroxybenzoate polyprenyltransferase